MFYLLTTITLAITAYTALVLPYFNLAPAGPGWSVVLLWSVGFSLLLFRFKRNELKTWLSHQSHAPHPPFRERLASAVPYLIVLPGLLALVLSTRMQVSVHGFFHSAYVYQLVAGRVPPENVTLPGFPANDYWPYHAVLAGLVTALQVSPPLASTLVNILMLIVSVSWLSALTHLSPLSATSREARRTTYALFSLFGANLLGWLHTLHNLTAVQTSNPVPPAVNPALLTGADPRLTSLFDKYLNFNGFPMGIVFYAFALYIVTRALQRGMRGLDAGLFFLAVVGALAAHTTSGLFIGIVLPVSAIIAHLLTNRQRRVFGPIRRPTPKQAAATLLGAVVAWPVVHFVLTSSAALPAEVWLSWPSSAGLISILAVTYPLLPFFGMGVLHAWKNRDTATLYLGLVSLIGLTAALFARLPDGNEYKFIFLSTIAMSSVALTGVRRLRHTRRALGRLAVIALLGMMALNVALVGVNRLRSPWFQDQSFVYAGRHVTLNASGKRADLSDAEYADVFEWIRNGTPADTVVVAPEGRKDDSTLYLLAERLPYVIDGYIYNHGLPAFETRQLAVQSLYAGGGTWDDRRKMIAAIRASLPNRPIVVIFPQDTVEASGIEQMLGITLLFQGDQAALYSLQ